MSDIIEFKLLFIDPQVFYNFVQYTILNIIINHHELLANY